MVEFAQKLVGIPSLPGQEGDVAAPVADEMERLGYTKVWIDHTGQCDRTDQARTVKA